MLLLFSLMLIFKLNLTQSALQPDVDNMLTQLHQKDHHKITLFQTLAQIQKMLTP